MSQRGRSCERGLNKNVDMLFDDSDQLLAVLSGAPPVAAHMTACASVPYSPIPSLRQVLDSSVPAPLGNTDGL